MAWFKFLREQITIKNQLKSPVGQINSTGQDLSNEPKYVRICHLKPKLCADSAIAITK
jgi:hypothetical protein